jgi:hypothetical protein
VALATTGRALSGDPSVSPTAREYTEPISLTKGTRIKARILDGSQWSALHELNCD